MEYHVTIKEMPESERPRERLYKYGPEVLSNSELIAIIISVGSKKESALSLSQRLLSYGKADDELLWLMEAGVEEISMIDGIGPAKACKIKAAMELGRRLNRPKTGPRAVIKTPDDVGMLLMDQMRHLKQEHFKLVQLDTKNKVIAVDDISIGTLDASIVHPREVFLSAIKRCSASVILVHNHPSGDPYPSKEDIATTERLVQAGDIVGITVLDHVIIGDGVIISLKERNLM